MNEPVLADNASPMAAAPRPRRRWVRWLAGAALGLALLALAGPTLFGWGPVRRAVLALALHDLNGRLEIDSARVGWITPIELSGIRLRPPEGPPAVEVQRVALDRSLLGLVFSGGDLGTCEVDRPELSLVVRDGMTNLKEIFLGRPRPEEPPTDDQPPLAQQLGRLAARLRVSDARVSFRGPEAAQPWRAQGIALEAALERPSGASASGLRIESGPLVPSAEITPGLCEDVLKFIAPNLAGVASASGRLSAELDPGWIPLDDLAAGEASGRVRIDSLRAGPGPLAKSVAELLKIESVVSIPDDTVIEFKLAQRRVSHSRFEFFVGPIAVGMMGSVGLDQTLNLEIEVPIPGHLLGTGSLAQALDAQTIVLPVGGTLSEPKIDPAALTQSGVRALLGVVEQLLRGQTVTEESLTEQFAAEGLELDGHLIQQWLEQRSEQGGGFLRRRRAARAAAGTAPAETEASDQAPPSEPGEPPEPADTVDAPEQPPTRGGLLRDGPLRRRLRERLRGEASAGGQPPESPPSEAGQPDEPPGPVPEEPEPPEQPEDPQPQEPIR